MNRRRKINRRRQIASAKRRIRRHNLLFSDVDLNADNSNAVTGWHIQANLQKDEKIIQLFNILYTISA